MTDTFDRLAWLRAIDPHLADAYRSAEVSAFDAPCAAYVALRGFAETFLDRDETSAGVPRGRPLYDRIEAARAQKLIRDDVLDGLDALRRDGNVAAHPAPEERKPERSVVDLLRVAWNGATWLHRRRGGREDEVPTFQAPTRVDSAVVFRDAMMGGAMGTGDPVAKFHVAQSLIEHEERMRLKAREAGEVMFRSRHPEALRLLQDARYSVPAARALHARLTLNMAAPGAEEIEEAISALQWGCEDNDPACMFELGVIRFHGWHGQPKDIEAARGLFERAASHEHPGAMHALAVVLCDGPADESGASARVLARRAAEAGELLGQANYGRMLIEGFGGEVDVAEGTMWLRRAVRQNLAQAVWSLSAYLRDGKVIALGDEDADALLARACELGSTEARLHRADAALHKPDATADFAAALNDLVVDAGARRGRRRARSSAPPPSRTHSPACDATSPRCRTARIVVRSARCWPASERTGRPGAMRRPARCSTSSPWPRSASARRRRSTRGDSCSRRSGA